MTLCLYKSHHILSRAFFTSYDLLIHVPIASHLIYVYRIPVLVYELFNPKPYRLKLRFRNLPFKDRPLNPEEIPSQEFTHLCYPPLSHVINEYYVHATTTLSDLRISPYP